MTEKSVTINEPGWEGALADIFEKEYFVQLQKVVRERYLDPAQEVFPPPEDLFSAFRHCPFEKVAVVILGQDPYHGKGQAHGMSFSVPDGVNAPPSLQNIFKEIRSDMGVETAASGNLLRWAEQGVFLLNAILTVEKNKPASHHGIGWEEFTDDVIRLLSENREHLVFLLWGNYAKQKGACIDTGRHLVLTAAHPSPYSANNGFFGCKHFSKANAYLTEHGKKPIVWA